MSDALAFALVAGLLTITPGLDTFLVLRSALRFGFQSGILASRFRAMFSNRTTRRVMDIISGMVFLFFGARVLRDTR